MDGKTGESSAQDEDRQFISIIFAILVVVGTIILFIFYQKRKSLRRNILLVGICDAGKTLIFSRLLHSKYVGTQTSIKENTDTYSTENKSVVLVDIPGHERVRGKFFDFYKQNCRGVVFIIDSVTLDKELRDVAEYLYSILSDPVIYGFGPNVLIACNKQDQAGAKNIEQITKSLEKEMNTVRKTKASQLQSVDPSDKSIIYLGKEGADFSFDSLKKFNIEFAQCSAHSSDGSCDMAELTSWIHAVM